MKKLIIKKPKRVGVYPWLIKETVNGSKEILRRGTFDITSDEQEDENGRDYEMELLVKEVDKVTDFPGLLPKLANKEENAKKAAKQGGLLGSMGLSKSMEWFMWVMPYLNLKKVCEDAEVNYTKVINFRAKRTKSLDQISIEKIRAVVEKLHQNQVLNDDEEKDT